MSKFRMFKITRLGQILLFGGAAGRRNGLIRGLAETRFTVTARRVAGLLHQQLGRGLNGSGKTR